MRRQKKIRNIKYKDIYSLDSTIAKLILPRLKFFRKKTCSYPIGLTLEEWKDILNNEFPEFETEDDKYWHNNITSNLRKMSEQCVYSKNSIEYSLYRMLWHPEETGLLDDGNVLTKEYVTILLNLLNELRLHKDKYEMYNPTNGWGSYDTLYNFVASLMTGLISINNDDYKNYTVIASY